MKNFKRLVLTCSMLVMAWAQGQTGAGGSDPLNSKALADAFASFRSTSQPELSLEVDAQQFSILRPVTRPISEAEAAEKMRQTDSPLPELRVTSDAEVIAFSLNSRTWVEKSSKIGDPKQSSWSIRSLEPVATFPRSAWGKFVEFCIRNGLSNLTIYKTADGASGLIYLDATGPESLSYGSQLLALSQQFYQNMRVSPEYPAFNGPNGFVVLVHDPHSDVTGRYDLMLGLEALVSANPGKNLEFLVEGAFPQDPRARVDYKLLANRKISDGGLAAYLKGISDVDHRPLVYSMLRRYLVDTPLAFNLLHPELKIPAYAIDDNRYLKETLVNYGDARAQRLAILQIIRTVDRSQEVPEKDKNDIASTGLIVLAMLNADLTKVSDLYLVQERKELADAFKLFASVGELLATRSPALKPHVAVLKQAASAYAQDAKIYENAMLRNETMAPFIAAEARKANSQLAIAFIGSYHTQGITAELRKQGIGYTVIEPRRRLYSNQIDADEKRFQRFLADPDSYFARIKTMNKGLASLTERQVDSYHKPFLDQRRAEIRRESSLPVPLPASAKVRSDSIRQSMRGNGSLSEATIQYGGGALPPNTPPPPAGAFGFVEPNGGRRKLVLLDPSDPRWSEQDRYDFLARATLVFPYSTSDSRLQASVSRFSPDRSTGRNFYSLYQPSTGRIYLMEAGAPDISKIVTLPEPQGKKNYRMHLQLGEVLPPQQEKIENDYILSIDADL